VTKRAFAWTGLLFLVVLGGRALAYALSPSPLAVELSRRAGGPALPVVTAVSLALGLAISATVVWLAALGVRERRLLETRPVLAPPRLRLGLLLGRAVALSAASMLAFALLESYIHWRAGLGWHGLHCLTGPVHRDAIPLLGALSLVAAATAGAVEHVLAWIQRTLVRLAAARPLALPAGDVRAPGPAALLAPAYPGALGARGPPTPS
jgi:hypothetical protein